MNTDDEDDRLLTDEEMAVVYGCKIFALSLNDDQKAIAAGMALQAAKRLNEHYICDPNYCTVDDPHMSLVLEACAAWVYAKRGDGRPPNELGRGLTQKQIDDENEKKRGDGGRGR